jgi:uncharacterized membrane protein
MSTQPAAPEVTSDDRLWAALGYPIWPLAVIVLLMEEKKTRPFIKFHAVQSLVLNAVIAIVGVLLTVITVGFGGICWSLFWLLTIWPAIEAYNGKWLNIPVITNFIKKQNWA